MIICDQRIPRLESFVIEAGAMTDYPEAEQVYAYLSGMTHPSFWAIEESIVSTHVSDGLADYAGRIEPQHTSWYVIVGIAAFLNGWRWANSWLDPQSLVEHSEALVAFEQFKAHVMAAS